jgi:hypothetical protein
MNRATFRRQLEEGLNAVFGLRVERYEQEWPHLFEVEESDKAYEEDVFEMGFGAAPEKAEGGAVAYDEGRELWVSQYYHRTVALAFAITEEAEEDGLYGSLASKYAQQLAVSMVHTKEVNAANVFNNGFNAAFPGGDGQPLFSTVHPLGGGGTLANTFTSQADLSEAALESAAIAISQWTDDRGLNIAAQIRKLAIPTSLQFDAVRILHTMTRQGTADNDINAMYKLATIPDGICINHRFTDQNAFYLLTDVPDGLKHFRRVGLQRGIEGDFETGNVRYKVRERYSEGWSNWRGVFGTSGTT